MFGCEIWTLYSQIACVWPFSYKYFIHITQLEFNVNNSIEIPLLVIRSLHNFTHTTTAELLCHVHNFVVITQFEFGWVKWKFSWIWNGMEKTYKWNINTGLSAVYVTYMAKTSIHVETQSIFPVTLTTNIPQLAHKGEIIKDIKQRWDISHVQWN